jgi:hypothetical protein
MHIQSSYTINPLSVSFSDHKTENDYRTNFLSSDCRQYSIGIALSLIPFAMFLYSDRLFFGSSCIFVFLLSLRSLFILLSILAIVVIKKMRNPFTVDLLLFSWIVLYFSAITIIYSTRPAEFIRNPFLDILMILVPYLVFNIRFAFQITPPLLFSAASIVFLSTTPGVTLISFNAIVMTYVFSNVMGIFAAWRLHAYRRVQFSHFLEEKKLNRELKEAMSSIRTLRGLMPICSKCRKIRDEEGYWKKMEEYIEQHSEAQFSHSLCDKCAHELYGAQRWFKK